LEAGYVNNILFKGKQVKLLLTLADKSQKWYISSLAKRTETTYVHTSKFIVMCEKAGIVGSEKHGKIKNLYLTGRGEEIAEKVQSIVGMLNNAAEQHKQPQAQ